MITLLSGTFDPIHMGHCRIAIELKEYLACQTIKLIPCKQAVHKDGVLASAEQRWQMVKAACEQFQGLEACRVEIDREQPSYSFDTLTYFRQQHPNDALGFVVGIDAFRDFETWYRWREIFDLTHLLVVGRANAQASVPPSLAQFIKERVAEEPSQLEEQVSGLVHFVPLTGLDISSTLIRAKVKRGCDITGLVPDGVKDIIVNQSIYND